MASSGSVLKRLVERSHFKMTLSPGDERLGLFLEYVPVVGPLYTSGTALRAMLENVGIVRRKLEGDESALSPESSRLIRVKSLTAIATGLADLLLLCFGLVLMLFVATNVSQLTTNRLLHQAVQLVVVLNVLAVSVGTKLVAVQMIEFSTSQLEQVQIVGTSVVRSASITATALEKIVVTTNSKTGAAINAFDRAIGSIRDCIAVILSLPGRTRRQTVARAQHYYRALVSLIKSLLSFWFLCLAASRAKRQ